MAKWEIEVIHEPSGQYMNFTADTDTEDFWDSILKNKSFKEWVRGKYQFAKTDSNVPLAEVTEEEEDDE